MISVLKCKKKTVSVGTEHSAKSLSEVDPIFSRMDKNLLKVPNQGKGSSTC